MLEWIMWMIEELMVNLGPYIGGFGIYEDGAPVIAPCTSPTDAAYLMLAYAHHFLHVARDGAAGQMGHLWSYLHDFCQ